MAITVDWLNKIIQVPRADLALIQSSPTEIRELNLAAFHGAMRDLEASETGVLYLPMHTYSPPASVGGITLAPVVSLINDYTITFEDGQYAVNLTAANSNAGDRVNVNQVSVRSANSAGLVQTREIEQAAFGGMVHIDAGGVSGTAYPRGTHSMPVNNLADAKLIAGLRGLSALHVMSDLTIGATDNLTEWHIHGDGATLNATRTKITFTSGNVTTGAHFHNCRIVGPQGGETNYHECIIEGLSNAHCHYDRCGFLTPSTYAYTLQASGTIGLGHITDLHDCYGDEGEAVIDRNGTRLNQRWQNYAGKIKFVNQNRATESGSVWIHMNGGQVTIDASCTTGSFFISGVCTVVNNGTSVVDTSQVSATSSGGIDYAALAAAILAAAQATPIHSDMRKTNGQTIIGDGTESDKFRSHLVG